MKRYINCDLKKTKYLCHGSNVLVKKIEQR